MLKHAAGGTGRREPTDVNALVDEYTDLAYHSLNALYPGFTLEIERDFAPEAGRVALVPQEIGQVLLNLLTNAFDAVKDRAAHLGASFTPLVRVATLRHGDAVVIRVEDNGPGVPPDLREKVFEPFFTTRSSGSGTGLGLSLSFDIVTRGHGGTLSVEGAAAGGAAFVLTLPTGIIG
jgi:C4-dicarboxylate-specific signal transduction histidine kinase